MRITTLGGLYNFDITCRCPLPPLLSCTPCLRANLFPRREVSIVPSLLWSALEVSLAIICVSIPALRPLFNRLFPSLFRTSAAANGASNRNPTSGKNGYQLSGLEGQRRTQPTAASANRRSVLDLDDDDDMTISPGGMEEGKERRGGSSSSDSGGRKSFGSGRTATEGTEVRMVDSTEELTLRGNRG